MEEAKVCTRCKKEKPLNEFHRNRNIKDGHNTWCKKCMREYHMSLDADGKNIKKNYAKQWHAENRERTRANRLRRDYNITIDEYDKMLEIQGNGCVICGKAPEENGKRLAVDHDHETGEIRGLLCTACNHGIGLFQDSPALLRSAANYLERFK